MARTQTHADIPQFPITEVIEKNTGEQKELLDGADVVNALQADLEDAFTALGRIETANFMATVADKVIAETALKLKKDKKYKSIKIKDSTGNWRNIATFEEFCEYKLNSSRRRVDELIANYKLLGSDLYEQAERLGFRQRDYNALKALPEDDQKLIAQAIEEQSLDNALDLMQQLAAKHQREKEALDKKINDLVENAKATDSVIKKKDDKLNELDREIEKMRSKAVEPVPDMPGEAELIKLQDVTRTITVKIQSHMRQAIIGVVKATQNSNGLTPKHIDLAIAQAMGLIITASYQVADDYMIQPVLDTETAADDPAKADAEAFTKWQAQQSAE